MFSGGLVVVLVILLLFRRVLWNVICLFIGDKLLRKKPRARRQRELSE